MTRWIDAGHAVQNAARAEERGSGIRGAIGDALFACAFGHGGPSAAEPWLQRAIDDIEANGSEVSLHRGIAGLGLVTAMYRGTELEELLAFVDQVTLERLGSLPPASLQSGAAGIALYASMRSGEESGRELQRSVLDRLQATANASDDGVTWATPVEYASARDIKPAGEPVVEYGIVHGVAGALVGLAALAATGHTSAAELARRGLDEAWIRARGRENRFGRVLFGRRGELEAFELDRRWCVGDPGVLRTLWLVARTIGDANSAQRALNELLVDAAVDARGDDHLNGRLDLCCGAAGVAQVYLRMHRETGEAVFREANRALLARCAQGFDRLEDTTFQYGRMGVLLALMAAEREEDPSWDAMLGVSLPRVVSSSP